MTSRIVPSICCLQFVFDEMAMSVLVVPEQRQQNDDRKGNAQQPQQQTASQAHCHLHQLKNRRRPNNVRELVRVPSQSRLCEVRDCRVGTVLPRLRYLISKTRRQT